MKIQLMFLKKKQKNNRTKKNLWPQDCRNQYWPNPWDTFTPTKTAASLANALGCHKSHVFRLLDSGVIRRHSNAIKPFLKDDQKIKRLKFCMSMLDQSDLLDEPKFVDMFNTIHIDENEKVWDFLSS